LTPFTDATPRGASRTGNPEPNARERGSELDVEVGFLHNRHCRWQAFICEHTTKGTALGNPDAPASGRSKGLLRWVVRCSIISPRRANAAVSPE
jgi:hypothetical protein